ncbi:MULTISPECIES: peptidoglycan DD-metalloendopeptidase family protein [Paraburkholderia]|uniref:peptidoglycan DD-metalloendopeptidase family protein n=1 Tax=Paraburkholderia TaxID=1822464 RepID=UPI0022597543|nr:MULTISPECIES: peptidoglycan DD-metalloendopeptidase family protein [Paraburkholderia]MCX4165112.1 peptidoglycan DD-metalloendopeptidase family protein [Paraburkholderia megapolitana]MDN7160605.1 peptidoglycan DD-metalloendopeptidase family protein [Paraburkholderia sp. CHISQ3]MDQ6497652.1 peptidoglycan DD-metalloendopeptidase family protein [Paraburkholderia megapolitana]
MLGSRFDITKIGLVSLGLAIVVSGCTNVAQQNPQTIGAAPVASASTAVASGTAVPTVAASQPAATPAPAQFYEVQRGDTLSRIAQDHNCSVADLQTWNGLKRAGRLKAGQTLRLSPPDAGSTDASSQTAKPVSASSTSNAPVASTSSTSSASSTKAAEATTDTSAAPDPAVKRQVMAQTARHASRVALAWPAQGKVVESFQPGETRGIEISGKPGDPIRAAASGKVMYAGTGLNEYGSLIIVQHNKDFLTAYSHNRKLLVKTGDFVQQGQQIAEMGDENNSRVALLFEVRRDGKPVDPMPYLPGKQG